MLILMTVFVLVLARILTLMLMLSARVYVQTYPKMGRVVGNFYDEAGKATAELAAVHKKAAEGKKIKVRPAVTRRFSPLDAQPTHGHMDASCVAVACWGWAV